MPYPAPLPPTYHVVLAALHLAEAGRVAQDAGRTDDAVALLREVGVEAHVTRLDCAPGEHTLHITAPPRAICEIDLTDLGAWVRQGDYEPGEDDAPVELEGAAYAMAYALDPAAWAPTAAEAWADLLGDV